MTKINNKEITFYYKSVKYTLPNEKLISNTIKEILVANDITEYNITFIFTNIKEITKLNNKYLTHNYPTDILTFNYSEDYRIFGGDIYICTNVVYENAEEYNTNVNDEMLRVIFHGILHLLGHNDQTEEEALNMRVLEEECIKKHKK